MIIEKPEVIQKKIFELQEQLKKSEAYYEYDFICNMNNSEESIGFFNIGNAKKILSYLNNGKTLKCVHGVYGSVLVKMNPQRNRIIVSGNSSINEENIMGFIVWHSSEWYLKLTD